MRGSFSDAVNNSLEKMAKTNRDAVNHIVRRETSYDARSTDYRRSGVMDFGAMQMMSLDGDSNFAMGGVSGSSPIVGI